MPQAKLAVIFAVLVMTVVIGTAAAAAYIAQPTSTTSTSVSSYYCSPAGCDQTSTTLTGATITTGSTTSTQSGSSGGLLVRLELNSSRIAPGAGIGIKVSDYNPSSLELNLSKGTAWPVEGLATGGCPSLYYPLGIAVFQGRYTSANASQAVPLGVFPIVACPMLVRYITGYLFQPASDNATVLPGTGVVPMAATLSVGGTYTDNGDQLNQRVPLSPGTYTVAAGDEWGNLAFAYFVVAAA